jgi:hypothetical protein
LNLPPEPHYARLASLKDGNVDMGSTGLMLNIITPLQKFSKGGTTITDVLKQRYEDLFKRDIVQATLNEVEDVYTKKKEVRVRAKGNNT